MRTIRSILLQAVGVLTLIAALSVSPAAGEGGAHLVCDIWPPYQVATPSGVTGMTVDIVKAVYKRMDIPIEEIRAYPWKRTMDAIRFGEADGLFSANHTPERSVYLRYPEEPLFESSWIIWTRAGSSIMTMEDLKGKTVGVVLGYSYTPEFWEFVQTHCDVEAVHSDTINFKKLNQGRLDATVAEYGNGKAMVRALDGGHILAVPRIRIKKDGLYMVFNRARTSAEFVQRFSEELRAFKQTEAHRLIREKYLGREQ